MNLEMLGATEELRAYVSASAPGCVLARVVISFGETATIAADCGERRAEPTGALLYGGAIPVTGDWVAARIVDGDFALIQGIAARRTLFARRAAGRRHEQQAIASNIDTAFLVAGLDGDFNVRRIERYLTLAIESGVESVIVLNKSDLCDDVERRLGEVHRTAPGTAAVAMTAHQSVEPLRPWLGPGRTVVLLGSSGAGKSTIANQLLGHPLQRTGEVRASDHRGRHTTSHRELMPLPRGGALIDTPGLREVQLWASEESLSAVFDDVVRLAERCRFNDCRHDAEPGCAVQRAIEAGEIDAGRWLSYRKLRSEIERHERLTDAVAATEEKRKLKEMSRAIRRFYKSR
jgi:ribosome biogenesis GTPase